MDALNWLNLNNGLSSHLHLISYLHNLSPRNIEAVTEVVSEDEIQSDELEVLQDYFEVRLSSPCVVSGNSELFNKD
jgi:hypothetical protein